MVKKMPPASHQPHDIKPVTAMQPSAVALPRHCARRGDGGSTAWVNRLYASILRNVPEQRTHRDEGDPELEEDAEGAQAVEVPGKEENAWARCRGLALERAKPAQRGAGAAPPGPPPTHWQGVMSSRGESLAQQVWDTDTHCVYLRSQ